jgi:glucose/arabinose dehydrogenase
MKRLWLAVVAPVLFGLTVSGQQGGRASLPLPALPQTFETAQQRIRVSAVATGLSNPWSLAFLPNGDMLVTERPGRLRIVRSGALDPQPVTGIPEVRAAVLGGLLEVALHPRFAENGFVYLSYSKEGDQNLTTTALARGRFSGAASNCTRRQQCL